MVGQPPRHFCRQRALRPAVWVTAWGLSLAPFGCQQLPVGGVVPVTAIAHQEVTVPADVIVDSLLKKRMTHDHWRSRSIWPEPSHGPIAFRDVKQSPLVRWELQQDRPAEGPAAEENAEETAADTETQTASRTPQRDPELQDLVELQRLAEEDSLAGWNACIQLAWKQPRVDAAVLNQLQRLALSPPEYDEATGLAIVEEPTPAIPEPEPEAAWWQRATELAGKAIRTGAESKAEAETSDDAESEELVAEKPTPKPLSDRFHAAAAEAWCWQLAQLPGDAEQNFVAAGLAVENADLPELVRAELQRGIARVIPPRRIPGFAGISMSAQSEPLSDSERTLLDACITYALHNTTPDLASTDHEAIMLDEEHLDPHHLWPTGLWEYRWSDQPEVISRFGTWLALTGHPLAESYLRQSLQHIDPGVHSEALRALGLLGSAGAREVLSEQAEEKTGTPRAIALLGLAEQDESALYAARDDKSAVVRSAVAKFAGLRPNAESAQILRQLAEDDDPVVQQAAVSAVENWSSELAFPVLATAFQQGSVPTRKLARKALETRFDLVIAAIDDDAEQRRQTLQQISTRFDVSADANLLALSDSHHKKRQSQRSQEIPAEARQRHDRAIERWYNPESKHSQRQAAKNELTELLAAYPQLFASELEQLPPGELAERIELYASIDWKPCRAVHDLGHDDLFRRREAARQLASQAEKETLPEWTLHTMAQRLADEQDVHVCRSLMQAIAADTTPAARAVAEAALVHSWPDVRILGCRYAGEQRLPQLAPFLLPLLHERNPSVQLAAIQAAGLCRNPLVIDGFPQSAEDQSRELSATNGGLRSLLGAVPPSMEFEVITSLTLLGDDQGQMELLKLCYSPSAERRIAAISLLGKLGEDSTVDHLIRLGWTEQDPGVRNAILASLKQLVPTEQHPTFPAEYDSRAQLERWAQWLEERRTAPSERHTRQ